LYAWLPTKRAYLRRENYNSYSSPTGGSTCGYPPLVVE